MFIFYKKKNCSNFSALKSLEKLRGPDYDVHKELETLKEDQKKQVGPCQ